MLCFIVRFHDETYPDDRQYMLTFAGSESQAMAQVMFHFAKCGISITLDGVQLDPVQWKPYKRKYKAPVRVRSRLRRDAL